MEELREFRNQARTNGGDKKIVEREGRNFAKRAKEEFRSRKFQQYTPLNTNRTRIL